MCISALIGLGSALIQGAASNRAARSQERASQAQLDLQQGVYNDQRAAFQPYRRAGKRGLDAYLYELGIGNKPNGYGGFQASNSFNNILTAGRDTIEGGASASGNLFSGATGTALEKFRTGLASNEVNNYLNRLGALGQQGQAAAGMQAGAGTNYAQMGSNSLANMGNAQAAGAIGIGNAISGGINTGLNAYGFFNNQDGGSQMGTMSDLFNNSWGPY